MSYYLKQKFNLQCDYWDLLPYSWMKVHIKLIHIKEWNFK
jgi:hypothetical protein